MTTQAFAPPLVAVVAPRMPSHHSRWLQVFGRNRVAVLGLVVVSAAIGAPLIATLDPFQQSAADRLNGPDTVHIMGRDTFGRDIFVRMLYAGRVSLLVGIGSVALGGALGTLVGLIAGYRGRWVESFFMRGVDVLIAFPSLLLGLTVLAVLGAGLENFAAGGDPVGKVLCLVGE